jgi:hypothetical protein
MGINTKRISYEDYYLFVQICFICENAKYYNMVPGSAARFRDLLISPGVLGIHHGHCSVQHMGQL